MSRHTICHCNCLSAEMNREAKSRKSFVLFFNQKYFDFFSMGFHCHCCVITVDVNDLHFSALFNQSPSERWMDFFFRIEIFNIILPRQYFHGHSMTGRIGCPSSRAIQCHCLSVVRSTAISRISKGRWTEIECCYCDLCVNENVMNRNAMAHNVLALSCCIAFYQINENHIKMYSFCHKNLHDFRLVRVAITVNW